MRTARPPGTLRPRARSASAQIFSGGAPVARDLSSADLAADLPPGLGAGYAADHAAVVRWVTSEARPGDTVLIMGARDPDLPKLARAVLRALDGPEGSPPGD